MFYAIIHALGGVPEWTNGALSKSVTGGKTSSGVRIPPPPRMNKQTQIIYNLVVIIFALVGVIVVLVLHIVGVLNTNQTQEQEHAPEPQNEHAIEPTDELPAPTPESKSQILEEPEHKQEPTQPTPTPTPQPTQQQTQQTQPFNDKDCGDFQTHAQAQAFFESQGGPAQDPHKLDRNKDGVVCESLR